MALNLADMDSCTPKARCLSGPNEGLAYDRDNPCTAPLEFDSLKCDCVDSGVEGGYGLWRVEWLETLCRYDREYCGGGTIGDTCFYPTGGYEEYGFGILLVSIPLDYTTTCCSPPDPANNVAYREVYIKEASGGPWVFKGAGYADTSCSDFVKGRYTYSVAVTAYKFNGVVVG